MDMYKIKIKAVVKHGDSYLIVKKWYDDRISEPYQWEFNDGDILFGEKADKAAERIVREQVGIESKANRVLYTWTYVVGKICNLGIAFLCEALDDYVAVSEELQEYKWVKKDELNKYITNTDMLSDIENAGL